jgi:hypothetical protein
MPSLRWQCGRTTCAIRYGAFCRFLRLSAVGNAHCHLLGMRLWPNEDGWIARAPECMALDKEEDTDG